MNVTTFFFLYLGYWNIIVHGRKHSYRLYTKMLNEAMRWANAIQGAIDSKVPIETPTQQLIRDIKVQTVSLHCWVQTDTAVLKITILVINVWLLI